MRRALAVVAAVVMIALAFVIRSWRDDSGRSDQVDRAAAPVTVVCATELAKVCDQLAASHPELTVVVEDAGRTYTTVTSADFDATASKLDGWLAPAPWADMAAESRQRKGAPGVFSAPTRRLARSPLVIVAWKDRTDLLRQRCGGDPSWRCIGDVAGTSWSELGATGGGDVKPGLLPPPSSAEGLLVAGQAVSSYFGRTDFSSNDFGDDAFATWFSRLASSATAAAAAGGTNSTTTPIERMLSIGRAAFDLTGSTEAASARAVTTGRDKDNLVIIYPSPAVTADVLMTPFTASARQQPMTQLFESADAATALSAAGWRVDGQALPAGARADVALPDTAGLPRAGVLDALRTRWQEAAR